MVFEDRVSKYPGRWTMIKSDGTSEIVTLVRNDEPIKEGTPINASTLNELSTVAGAINAKDEAVAAAQTAASERAKAEQAATNAANEVKADLKEYSDNAASSASAAKTSESNAKTSETESAKNLQGTKEYFEQVRTITIGAQGWYATPEALKAAVPVGENGWWAVVGTTDTIWTWDGDTGAWKDSVQKADMSDFYTQAQVDALLAEYAYSKTEADARFALTADKITAALGYDPGNKITRLERIIGMDGKLVFSGAGVCTGGTTTMAIPSTVDYVEIVSAIPAMGRNGRGHANTSGYTVAVGTTLGVSADFGHAKVARGGSAAVALTGLATSGDETIGNYIHFNNESADVSLVSVSFASDGTLSISGGSSANRFTVYGYQYL
jgi:hypothetical protein